MLGGPIAIPMILLLGYLMFSNQLLSLICLVGLLAWLGGITVFALINQEWNILFFPMLVVLAWMLIPKDD